MNKSDIRRERLARYLAEGMDLAIAGRKAGFMDYSNMTRVAQEPGVKARVAEIVEMGLPDTVRTSGELDGLLDELLDADTRLYFNDQGYPLNPTLLRNAEALALTGYKEGRYGVELKWTSKLDVLKLAMQRRGMLVEKHEVTGKDGGPVATIAAEMSAAEAAELYRSMLG